MPTRDTPETTSGPAVWTLIDALLADGQGNSGPLKDKDRRHAAPAPIQTRRRLPSFRLAPIAFAAIAVAAFLAYSSYAGPTGGTGSVAPSVGVVPESPPPFVSVPPNQKKQAHKQARADTVAYTATASSTELPAKPKPTRSSNPPKSPADKAPPAKPDTPEPQPETTDPVAGLPIELPELPIDLAALGLGS
jgi:hypothetical protein